MSAQRLADVIRRTHVNLAAAYAKANPGGPSLTQIAVLDCIKASGTLSGIGIMDMTGSDRSTIFEMLGRMKRDGLIVSAGRARSVKAGRKPEVFALTPDGKIALKAADKAVSAAERHIMARVPQADRIRFSSALMQTAFATVK